MSAGAGPRVRPYLPALEGGIGAAARILNSGNLTRDDVILSSGLDAPAGGLAERGESVAMVAAGRPLLVSGIGRDGR